VRRVGLAGLEHAVDVRASGLQDELALVAAGLGRGVLAERGERREGRVVVEVLADGVAQLGLVELELFVADALGAVQVGRSVVLLGLVSGAYQRRLRRRRLRCSWVSGGYTKYRPKKQTAMRTETSPTRP
jgi:hypothetical protein